MTDDAEDPLDSDAVHSAESAYAEMCIAQEAEEAEEAAEEAAERMRAELARPATGFIHREPLVTLTLNPPDPDEGSEFVTITAIETSGGKRDWSTAAPEEIDAEVERIMLLSDEQVRDELIAAGEDPEEVAAHTREILLGAIAEACPVPTGYELDGPYMQDPQTGQGRWDATVHRRRIVSGVASRSEALAACHRDVRNIVAAYVLASEEALDEIASLCGCAQWDYPGQIVRDVKALLGQYTKAQIELVHLADQVEQYKDVQVMTMAQQRMVQHYKTLVDKNRELERRVTELGDALAEARTAISCAPKSE